MKPIFSIIIPTYNREFFLSKTIKSVLNQTLNSFELLVCDDGSTDNSEAIVKSFKDARIKWIPGANSGGPAKPRNRGIHEAKGEWLAFLDSDDLWMPQKLEKQLNILKNTNLMAVCTNARIIKNEIVMEKLYYNNGTDKVYTFKDMIENNYVICSSMVLHNSIAKKVGGFPEHYTFNAIEDYPLWISATMLTDIYYINDPLTLYRDEPYNSIRGKYIEDEKIRKLRILYECLKRTKKIKRKRLIYFYNILLYIIRLKLNYQRT